MTPQAVDAARERGILHKREFTEWQREREAEWNTSLNQLKENHLLETVMKFCIYQQQLPTEWLIQGERLQHSELDSIEQGLKELERLWCKGTTF